MAIAEPSIFTFEINSPMHGRRVVTAPARFRTQIEQWNWHVSFNRKRAAGRQLEVASNLPRKGKESAGKMRLHRLIWSLTGHPSAPEIDHIDGDPLNNSENNLRAATRATNACNQRLRADNRSGLIGVRWRSDKGRWMAEIRVNGKSRHIGYFDSSAEAAVARDSAARRIRGEFAVLNCRLADDQLADDAEPATVPKPRALETAGQR